MVFLILCTKICKCTERCARVDFPPTGSKWRSCGSTPLKTIVFEAIVILHRTPWLRMRAFLVRPSIFLILRHQNKKCLARVRPTGNFLIQSLQLAHSAGPGFGAAAFGKLVVLENSVLAIFIFGHFRFPRVEIQTQRVETKRNTLSFYVFDSKMSLLVFLPFFFLIMYDDG